MGAPELTNSSVIAALADELIWQADDVTHLLELLRESRALLLAGPPGTGKTFIAKAIAEAVTRKSADRELTVFHPAFAYEDFVEGIRPALSGNRLSYEMRRGVRLRMIDRANAQPDNLVVLVIDELNRGNVPRIFGELLHVLEYRGRLNQVIMASGDNLIVPENLWTIATMNTADRSIVTLDAAIRRRFGQKTLAPDYEVLRRLTRASAEATAEDATERLRSLNDELLAIIADSGK